MTRYDKLRESKKVRGNAESKVKLHELPFITLNDVLIELQ